MCGIAGSTATSRSMLETLVHRLRHRGPDGHGIWFDAKSGCGLIQTRLAIIDLSDGGRQPRLSPCGRWAMTFNGEIYNYRELRADLESKGHTFSTESDTEVLMTLLQIDGIAALSRLVGMFAIALWDREKQELLLIRDRLGIKPLVYTANGKSISFASEIGALAAIADLDLSTDFQAISEYLACLYVPAPRTAFEKIKKLPPGHFVRWRDGRLEDPVCFWKPSFKGNRSITVDEAVEEVEPKLRSAVRAVLVSDVPVGSFLSGGIDSSVISCLMAEEMKRLGGPPLRTFTMTFDAAEYDERRLASQVSAFIGSQHTELAADVDLAGRLDDTMRHFGEPFGNPTSILVDRLSAAARAHVKVAVVGDGGDEVFAGYPRYKGGLWATSYDRWVPRWLHRAIVRPLAGLVREDVSGNHTARRAREFMTEVGADPKETYAAWVEYFSPDERNRLLGSDSEISGRVVSRHFEQAHSRDVLDAMQEVDIKTFLPGNLLAYGDTMSMAHGLELRLPLLDHSIIDCVGAISPRTRFADGQKTILRALAERLLPAEIARAPKKGFNPPLGLWLNGKLKTFADDRLRKSRLYTLGLDSGVVEQLIREHREGRRDHSLKIWGLLALEAWERVSRDNFASLDA